MFRRSDVLALVLGVLTSAAPAHGANWPCGCPCDPAARVPLAEAPKAAAPAKPAQAEQAAKPVKKRSPYVGPSPVGVDVAPYFWTWAKWGDYPVKTLVEGVDKAGLKSATLAFELSKARGQCEVAGNFKDMAEDIKAFKAKGGRLILSFGGATDEPPYVQTSCQDPTSLWNLLGAEMDAFDTHALDFDIEGENLGDTTSNYRLLDALKELQERYVDLYVSFTLPVDAYSGLPTTAVDLLEQAAKRQVRVSRVNVMTMDFGQMPPAGKTSGDMVLGSVKATIAQLEKIYPKVDPRVVRHMVGITPLIGQNDPPSSGSFYFRPSDAEQVAAYAKAEGIGLLSFWGLMRDRAGSGSNNDYSNAQDQDFVFYNAFKKAQ